MTDLLPVIESPGRRFNEVVTTLLDALALLAVSAGIGLGTFPRTGLAGALFFGGCTLAVLSTLTQHSQRPKVVKGKPGTVSQPGPEDAGHLHVMGR